MKKFNQTFSPMRKKQSDCVQKTFLQTGVGAIRIFNKLIVENPAKDRQRASAGGFRFAR
jgi:hypothetical protein